MYTQFENFFLRMKGFSMKYHDMNLAGSAKNILRQPSWLRQSSSSLSQTMCTLVSRVVKPDGDEPSIWTKLVQALCVDSLKAFTMCIHTSC